MSSTSTIFEHIREIPTKFHQKFDWEIAVLMKKWIEFWFNSIFNFAKCFHDFWQKIEFGAVQKYVNIVDLEKCCKMSIYLPKSALIQPRTSRLKLPDRPRRDHKLAAPGSERRTGRRSWRQHEPRRFCHREDLGHTFSDTGFQKKISNFIFLFLFRGEGFWGEK